jgi:hypothetical protein
MIAFLKGLQYRRRYGDVVSILLLLGLSSYLMRPLFDWNAKALGIAGDSLGSWAWFYWLKESLFGFHQFPTWSPLWMSGIPFFGRVSPGGFFLVLPFYAITGDIPAAYALATITMFSLAGVFMYLYLKHLSQNSLASFLGAVVYIILPVHIGSMMFWGLFEIMCAYAVIPLALLFTDRFLDGKRQLDIVLLGLSLSFVLLFQVEYALIFLLFYVCYLAFALAVRRIGFHSILSLIRQNKVGTILCLLILLVPLSFYMTTLAEYGNFSGLTSEEIEGGLSVFTLRHFGDAFQLRAHDYLVGYSTAAPDYYCGVLSFVVLLASICFVPLQKDARRAQLLFFLTTGVAFLILSMGIFGPLFPAVRKLVPLLSGMRAPVRFYYIFALCLPVLFTLSFLSFANLVAKFPRAPISARWLLKNGAPVAVIFILMIDFNPYFDFYHHRVMEREAHNKVSSFLEERIKEDNLAPDNVARVVIAAPSGSTADAFSRLEQTEQGQFTIEIAQSWISWNQYKAAASYSSITLGRILGNAEFLGFYSKLLSYDYIMTYRINVPPSSLSPSYLALMDEVVETLNSFCSNGSGVLVDRGSLDTQYHTIHLYKINNGLPGKARFYGIDDSLFINNGGLNASNMLFGIYRDMGGQVTSDAFSKKIVTIGGDRGLPGAVWSNVVSMDGLYPYGDQALLLCNDPLTAKLLEAEDCETKGWVTMDREGTWGVPTSGVDMAVTDVGQVEENYLKKSFFIAKEGTWILDVSYLTFVDTGRLEVSVDGRVIRTVDTYGGLLAMRTCSAELFLSQGVHEVMLVGRQSNRYITTGSNGNWVEVDSMVLLNKEALPQIVAQSEALWDKIAKASTSDNTPNEISNFRLSPRGISLDIDAANDGILSVAYYANPWWRVYVDGKEVEVLKVNGLFPGCYIGEGQHHVEFIYNYPSPANLFSAMPR